MDELVSPLRPMWEMSDVYRETRPYIELKDATGGYAGQAERTGITCPGYTERAVYRLPDQQYYVYEAGQFTKSSAWHRDPVNVRSLFALAFGTEAPA